MFDAENGPTAPFEFDVAMAATKGAREYQEDSLLSNFAIGRSSGFAIIADGIGGHVEGHLASSIVTAEVYTHLKLLEEQLDAGKLSVPFVLESALKSANQKIADHIKSHADTKGMGTTLLVPLLRGDRLSWVSVGDSPLYLLRGGALRQINKDHSMAPQLDIMVASGSMTKEVAKDHPDRNTLTSVVSGDDIPQIDCPSSAILIKDGDVIVAATDGLQSLSTATIAKTIIDGASQNSVNVAKTLLEEVEKLGKVDQDNTSFVVIKANARPVEEEVMDLDAMPVLAQVDEGTAEPIAAATPEPAVEAPKKERKVRWYRGQKYYDD